MGNKDNGSSNRPHGFFKPSMIVLIILCAYLIGNLALRFADHPYPETMKLINFGLFVGLIYYFLRKPLLAMLDAKIADVDELLKSTQSDLEASRTERDEARRALDGIDNEIENLLARAKERGELERTTLIDDGKKHGRNIVEQAAITLKGREREIRQEIREEISGRCIDLARSRIQKRLTPEVHLAVIRARISSIRSRA